MKGCVFITKKDSLYGFSLAGFQQIIADKETVLEIFSKIVSGIDAGLVFIDERLLEEGIVDRLRVVEKQWGGAIIALPAPGKEDEFSGDDFGKSLISRVLGYQMKLS